MEPTPLSFAIQLFLGSLFILFLYVILFAKRGCSPRRWDGIRRLLMTDKHQISQGQQVENQKAETICRYHLDKFPPSYRDKMVLSFAAGYIYHV